jgi:hypothetical protein
VLFTDDDSETLTLGAGLAVVVNAVVGECGTPSTRVWSATTTEELLRLGTRKQAV